MGSNKAWRKIRKLFADLSVGINQLFQANPLTKD